MPKIQLKATHTLGESGALWLYSPLPGRALYEVRNQLMQIPGVRIIWQGALKQVSEYQAVHWVDVQRNIHGGTGRGYRDYQVSLRSMYDGKENATNSLRSAVVAMLPKDADIEAAEVIVARHFG